MPLALAVNPRGGAADEESAMPPPPDNEHLLGRIAVHTRLITPEQLEEACDEQGRTGGRIRLGEIFVERGWITGNQLQKLLAAQRQVMAKQAAKRAGQVVAAAVPGPEPGAVTGGAVPDPAKTAPPMAAPARTRPADPTASPGTTGRAGDRPAAGSVTTPPSPPAPASATAPRPAARRPEAAAPGSRDVAATAASGSPRDALHAILREGVAAGVSDVHVHGGAPLRWRRHGELEVRGADPLPAERSEAMLRAVLSDEHADLLDAEGQVDFAYTLPGVGRFRVNVYRQQRGVDGVFRIVPDAPPSLDDLGLSASLARLTNFHQGMVLVTGPAGCGKSSTMAAFLNLVNEERTDHILTIEDPIEVIHPSKRCLVNQRQVRAHTETFARALRAALREDPDVIAIGELRDLETISLALTAAETGHFVLGTLHTSSTIRTIDRLIGVFPPDQQGQVRTMLSESLRAVISQRLVRRSDGEGRVPALEVLVVNKAASNLIRENKTFQIRSILQTGGAQGMCLLDGSLEELVKSGVVSRDEARRHCEDPKRFGGASS
jgi:twitching motility protein PilT